MKIVTYSILLFIAVFIASCSTQKKTFIVINNNEIGDAGNDLLNYLSKTYPKESFLVSDKIMEGEKNIVLEIDSNGKFRNNGAYQILGDKNRLKIQGKTQRAVANGVYGLLKEIGWNFYLSFEIPPNKPKPLDFAQLNFQNSPLKEKRIIFDWHNFLSGCTGWDYEQWKEWIDNSSKIGFNTIMVHAYGNNPMQSFSFNGQEKELGYLTTSQQGRDWGAQHVNDIRLMVGGEIYSEYEFGSAAAKVPKKQRSEAATSLMQKVFKHAAEKSMDVCFAIDVDTWMANPQNVINTLPKAALLEIGGYNTANPENPEGRKYYEAQIKKLLNDYPEITMLAAWMRMPRKNPGLGSIWLKYDSETLPDKWRKEYFEILKKHPELKDEQPYPGLFAISKIVEVYRGILDEIRPDVELVLGSWRMYYPKQADAFMPKYCGFIPLDWEVVFDKPEVLKELAEVGKNRNLYPIVWAHHDDHRYVGRPYKPFSNFNSKLDKVNAKGYGIIHWTTHPLDLYFTNTENQVWQNTENETQEKASENFAKSLLKSPDENLFWYFEDWFKNAPMFGRETSDNFLRPNVDYNLEGYNSSEEVVTKANERLEILQKVNTKKLNFQGVKEYNYQLGMEEFLISFFENHHNIYEAFKLLGEGKPEKALPFVQESNPEKSIKIYAKTISDYGATRGEEGILLSLNLRWLPDYIDVRQRVGLEPVRINFQPTSHDPLAQGAGHNTFFIDAEKNFWLAKGEKELGILAATNGNLPLKNVTDSWVEITGSTEIPIKTMRNFNLPAGEYKLKLIYIDGNTGAVFHVLNDGNDVSMNSNGAVSFKTDGGNLTLKMLPNKDKTLIAGMVISKVD